MATLKSYTDIEQSKKLAEILPLESADMSWVSCDNGQQKYYQAENRRIILNYEKKHWIPCWSLAALLDVLPNENMLVKTTDGEYYGLAKDVMTKHYDNPVDACVKMIMKLNELKLL